MNGENDTMYYIHKDYLGSYDVITDEKGKVLERLSFDPWGRRRNPVDWTFNHVPANYLFDRGYTGHEHLDVFSLINMNGRVYDPWLGRFLSPDPVVQSPSYSQSYNRYSYCFNNPLEFSDPGGYCCWKFEPADWMETFGSCYNNSIFRVGWNSNSGSGMSAPGSYRYDWDTGKYYNSSGDAVSWDEVFVNYVQPNSVGSENNNNRIKNTDNSHYQGALRLRLNSDGQMQIISVVSADGERIDLPYVPNERFESSIIFLDSENGEGDDLSYIAAEASSVALFLSDHAIEQFIKANATARTYFTTLSGGTKYISKSRLLGFCEVAGKYCFWASIGVNGYGVLSGKEHLPKAVLNVAVDYLPFVIGTGPGLAIGVIYYGIDYSIGWDKVMTPAENHPYIYYGPGGVPLPK